MLSQVNYRVPNMRFLRERLTVRASWAVRGGGRWRGQEPLASGPDQGPAMNLAGPGAAQQRHHVWAVCSAVPQPHVQRPEDGA